MELFNRVKEIAKHFTGSDKALAEKLGFKQATFSGYLNEKRQDNLWPLLPNILSLFPSLSRDWLYFGEGPMLKTDAAESPSPNQSPAQTDNSALLELLVRNKELEERRSDAHRGSPGQSPTCHLGQTCDWCSRRWHLRPYQ